MKKYFDILRKSPLFDGICDTELEKALAFFGAKIITRKKGGNILSEGDPAKFLGIVLSGKVRIIRIDYYGNRSILASLEPPHIFGEAFACAETEVLPISVEAAEDTAVMLIDADRITGSYGSTLQFHSRMVFNLLKIVSHKNIELNQRAEITSKRSTREKLLAYLAVQAKRNESRSFIIPYNRQELADYLEVDRSGLSAEISKLRRNGIIECKRSAFTLL